MNLVIKAESLNDRIKRLVKKHGVEGVNRPKMTPSHATKKAVVVAKEGNTVKVIRFGAKGYKHNYSPEGRRKFKQRHAKNIKRGKLSAAYWADKFLWAGPKGHKQTRENAAKKRLHKATATKRDPAKWERAKKDAKAKMGGKHSARAMQLAVKLYKERGGTYSGKKPTKKTNSLKKWTKQKWKWSGDKKGKGVYLPKKKVEALKRTESGRKKLQAAGKKKAEATKQGKQYSRHGLAAGTSMKKTVKENQSSHELLKTNERSDKLRNTKVNKSSIRENPPKKYKDLGITSRSQYAVPSEFKYPLDTEKRVRAAISYFSQPENANVYNTEDQKKIWSRITSAAKKHKISLSPQSGPPSVEKKDKMRKSQSSIDMIKSLDSRMQDEVSKSKKAIADEIEKGLKAAVAYSMYKNSPDYYKAGIARPQPHIGTNRTRGEHETPVVPVRRVVAPEKAPMESAAFERCAVHGYMHKSSSECPMCVGTASSVMPSLWGK